MSYPVVVEDVKYCLYGWSLKVVIIWFGFELDLNPEQRVDIRLISYIFIKNYYVIHLHTTYHIILLSISVILVCTPSFIHASTIYANSPCTLDHFEISLLFLPLKPNRRNILSARCQRTE